MDPLIATAWVAEVGIIGVRDLAQQRRPPLPAELLATFVIFGGLSVLAIPAPKAAGLIGWGLVLATLLAATVSPLAPVGDFLAGRTPGTPTTASGGTSGSTGPKPPVPAPPGSRPVGVIPV